ncbi:conserved hypothetical protein [Roseibium sp. TrichSKD4]|uniref:hypothetical protein n=1 Tax=Roseibium sp. TrichSKD4 TaxID=744980 RepID=UPI0001E5721B|nr:hypothetical protein [Roseibium sp. TrichSKD4]EFO28777.1 conserved hypothetical protein [Roseibium sp. TrichSKD4]
MRPHSVVAAFVAANLLMGSVPSLAQAPDCYLPEKPFDYHLPKSDPLYEYAREEFQTYLEDLESYMRCLEQARGGAFRDLSEGYEEYRRIYGSDAVLRSPSPSDPAHR